MSPSPSRATLEATRARIVEVLAGPLADLGLDVEAVELSAAGNRRMLRVAVDQDGGVRDQDLVEASRAASEVLDSSDVMGEHALHARGHLTGSGPPAHAPPALAAQCRAAGARHARRRRDRHGPDHARQRRRGHPRPCRATSGRSATPTSPRPSSRSSSTGRGRRCLMDIDLSILRMLEREKEISFDVLVEAIEQALLTAYHKSPGAQDQARVELDRKSGHVSVLAAELDDEGNVIGEHDDTPEGFGRIAATTAKQIMLQRLRDAEDEIRFGEFSGKEGDIVSGVIQQGRNPDDVLVDLGKLEALLPGGERVAGETYDHGTRIKCSGDQRPQGHAGSPGDAVAVPPEPGQEALRARGSRDRRRHGRDRGDRPRGRAPHQDRGPVRRCLASTPRAPASARWGSGCATSCPSSTARRSTSSTGPTNRPRWSPTRSRRPRSPLSR